MELETVNKLYLELSQFATAKTKNDLELEKITERSRRRGKLLADIFNHEDVNLPLELMNRIDAEVMGHNVEHNRRPQGVRVDGPVGPLAEET